MKFKSDIEIQAGVEAGGSTGSNGQVLSSTGSGVAWIDQNAISAGNAEHVVIYAKNTHTASIAKGTPVYITGTVGATDTVQIAPADASDSAKMPAVGLLNETLAVNAFGYVITGGFMDNITTDPIDGATPSSNDTVYVKAGGGLTLTKPTGPTGLIQNVAKVGKVSGGNSGSLIVSSILRTNDVPNLTTGKIWVGDGNTVESTVVHLDEANGRMGIGTTSPNAVLDVSGAGNFSGGTVVSGIDSHTDVGISIAKGSYVKSNDGNYLRNLIGQQSGGSIEIGQGGTGLISNINLKPGSSGNIDFFGSGSVDMRVASSGNVGIGTTSPSEKLEVIGRTKITKSGDALRINSSDANGPYVTWQNNGSNIGYIGSGYHLWSSPNNIATSLGIRAQTRLDLGVQANVHMTILNNGNVGIGTTSPQKLLEIKSSNAYDSTLRLQTSAHSWDIQGGEVGYSSTSFALDYDGATFFRALGVTDSRFSGGLSVGTINATPPTSGLYVAGNVGIGTTSPGEPLTVKTKTAAYFPGIKIEDYNSSMGLYVQNIEGENSGIGTGRYYNSGNWRSDVTAPTTIRLDGGAIRFYAQSGVTADTNYTPTQRMTINADGNVGIGTTSPSNRLQVSGGSIGIDSEYMIRDNRNNTILLQSASTAASNRSLTIGNATYSNIIVPNGNVGIGTTSPARKLEVYNGSSSMISQFRSGSGTSSFICFANTGSTADQVRIGSISTNLVLSTNYTERMRITSGGNVGIGTTSPSYKLEVQGPTDSQGFVNDEGGNKNRLLFPKGGSLNSGPTTGAITVKLPVLWTNTMLRITLRVFDYSQNESFDVTVAGYNYVGSGSGGSWVNTSAWISSQSDIDRNFSVRFGNDGTNSLFYIGELDSSWSYLKVNIVDVELNHAATVTDWSTTAWSISMETTAFANVSQIRTNCQVNNWKRNGQDVYYGSGTGNVGIGTTSPQSKLHIADSTLSLLKVQETSGNTGASAGALFKTSPNTGNSYFKGGILYEDTGNANVIGKLHLVNRVSADTTNAGVGDAKLTIDTVGNVGIGTTDPTSKLTVSSSIGADGSWNKSGILIENTSTTTGEPTLAFRNAGTAGTGANYWHTGLNQSNVYKIAYGTSFTDGNTKFELSTNGTLRLNSYTQGFLQTDANGNVSLTGGGTLPGGPYLPLSAGSSYPLTGDLYLGTFNKISGVTNDNLVIGVDINNLSGASSFDIQMDGSTSAFYINNSRNVGIGTTSPQSKLHIETGSGGTYNPNVNHDDVTIEGSGNIGLQLFSPATTYQYIAFGDPDSVNAGYIRYYHGANQMVFRTNGGDRLHIDSSGNVGIGTSSPSVKLDVSGTIKTNALFLGDTLNNSANTHNIIYRSGTSTFIAGGNKLVVQDSGKVGIGTNSPTAKLHVLGTSTGDATTKAEMLSNSVFSVRPHATNSGTFAIAQVDGGNSVGMQFTNSAGTSNWDISLQPFGGNVGIGTTSPQYKIHSSNSGSRNDFQFTLDSFGTGATDGAQLGIQSGGAYIWNFENNDLYFATNNSRALTIKPSGNVGIGTTSPGYKLDVNGSMHSTNITIADGIYHEGDSNNYISFGTDIQAFTTSGSERMRINSAGNVGVGTTSPLRKLHVDNSSGVGEAVVSGTTGATLYFRPNTSYSLAGNFGIFTTGLTSGTYESTMDFKGYYNGVTTPLTIKGSGNVGIGTNSPTSPLTIKSNSTSSSSSGLTIQSNGNTNNIFELAEKSTDGARLQMYDAGVAKIALYTDGTDNYINAGNVGIGTTSPARKLEVYDGSSSMISQFRSGSGTSSFICFANTGSTADQVRIGSISTNLVLSTNYTERMRITSGGNVGIGTTSPGYTLDVNGSIHSTNITIADAIYHEGDTNNYIQFHTADQWRVVTGGVERLEVQNTQVTVANNFQVAGSIYAAQYIYHSGDTNTYMRFPSNDTISWNTAGSERMRINSSGNIGIGTTAPTNKLHVTGTIYGNGGIIGSSDLWLRDQSSAYSTELKMQNNTHTIGIDYQNNETLRFITRSGTTTVPITFAMRTGNITCVSLTQTSDERKKTKIKDLSGDNIDVRWRSFEMKANEGEYRTGVIAQELEQNHPEFVNTDDEGLKSVKYIDLLIAKIAELETRIKQLENN